MVGALVTVHRGKHNDAVIAAEKAVIAGVESINAVTVHRGKHRDDRT